MRGDHPFHEWKGFLEDDALDAKLGEDGKIKEIVKVLLKTSIEVDRKIESDFEPKIEFIDNISEVSWAKLYERYSS